MSRHFLYERWRDIARAYASELALFDEAQGKAWSFHELDAASERGCAPEDLSFPRGQGTDFVLALLRSWRAGMIACPMEAGQTEPAFAAIPPGVAHLKLTSATGGIAKCAAFTGAQLAADAANIVSTMGLRREWPNLACISLAHSYGFSNLVLPLLLHGIPLVLAPAPLPEILRAVAQRFSAITLPAVPALWKVWHESKAIVPQIALAISAGAPLPLPLEQAVFDSCGVKIHNFYGSTECGGIAFDRSSVPRAAANCAGTALDNVELTISSSGTLVVESGAVAETYWPEAGSGLGAGRFVTADLVEINGQTIHLLGRVSDLLNVAGRKAAPDTIENLLRSHPAVLECVVFGADLAVHERADTIVAVVRTRTQVEIAELAAFLSGKLPGWQIPRKWWFTDALTPNSRGKISRPEWKRRFLASQGSAP